RAAIPALEESLAFNHDRRAAVLSTFARMLKDYPGGVSADLAARLRGEILASADVDTLAFIAAAHQGELTETAPWLQHLHAAGAAPELLPAMLADLTRARDATPPSRLLAELRAAHVALCRNATGPIRTACQSRS